MNLIKKVKAWYTLKKISHLYKKNDYLEAYQQHTDIRIDHNPQMAIGGDWDLLGNLQFNFLKDEGLQPGSTLLDIGMGTLRGGRFFIEYLNEGNYTGFDISPKAVAYSKQFVKKSNLTGKKPNLLLNHSKNLKFSFLSQKYDFILAQSVFTHLLEEHIEEAFANIHKVMHKESRFYFTTLESDRIKINNHKDIYYPTSFFREKAIKYNYEISDYSSRYDHPKGQKMLMVTPVS
jgi:SAM-dependent methyltransferase